jgi:hypothetical protein
VFKQLENVFGPKGNLGFIDSNLRKKHEIFYNFRKDFSGTLCSGGTYSFRGIEACLNGLKDMT